MENINKIVKSLVESGLIIKVISETIKNQAKEQKGGFPRMLLGVLAASLLGSALGQGVIRAGKGVIPPHPLTNLEMQTYYQNGPKFNVHYSRNHLFKMNE